MIVRGRAAVSQIYADAARRRWVVPTFCAENQTTVEAILSACEDLAIERGCRIPVTIGLTGRYAHRSQAAMYAQARNWRTGLELFFADCEILARPDGDYPHVDALLHFDHAQYDLDRDLLESTDLLRFSSVMYDASAAPWPDNLHATAAFVQQRGGEIYVEGACDEIVDAVGTVHNALTTPKRAAKFLAATRVDMMVVNLGTEHRATAAQLHYDATAARAIAASVGTRLVLHGASSVSAAQLRTLFDDGVCKVNIWTTLERDTAPVLLDEMLRHASEIIGGQQVQDLKQAGLLGPRAVPRGAADIAFFTTAWRHTVVFAQMKIIIRQYLDLFYRDCPAA